MKVASNFRYKIMIRLGKQLSLIFFVLLALPACRQKEQKNITIAWTDKKATGLVIPRSLLKSDPDSLLRHLQVRLSGSPGVMLGEFVIEPGDVVFKPLTAFSRGLNYEIFFKGQLLGVVHVPIDSLAKAPRLLAIYPSSDT